MLRKIWDIINSQALANIIALGSVLGVAFISYVYNLFMNAQFLWFIIFLLITVVAYKEFQFRKRLDEIRKRPTSSVVRPKPTYPHYLEPFIVINDVFVKPYNNFNIMQYEGPFHSICNCQLEDLGSKWLCPVCDIDISKPRVLKENTNYRILRILEAKYSHAPKIRIKK